MKNENMNVIPKEKFRLVQSGARLQDMQLKTKPIGYLQDAMIRFKKNKSSVIAAIIIIFLIVYAIAAPIISPYKLTDKEDIYRNKTPSSKFFSLFGFWDGAEVKELSEVNYNYYSLIGAETGLNPITKLRKEYEVVQSSKTTKFYSARVNSYLTVGVIFRNIAEVDYEAIQQYQNETGRQVLYPMVDVKRMPLGLDKRDGAGNYWYLTTDRGVPILKNGELQPIYLTSTGSDNYHSIRPDFDDGTLSFGVPNESGYRVRICYYEYYIYKNGHAPSYVLGTTSYGQDMFAALGYGARFSLLLAIGVALINFLIGVVYGAIEGYYGGATDMIMERISDVLAGIPFIVAVSLFQFHLAAKVGVVPSFLFAFVLIGWLGTAAVVRKQFYRFKGMEYILAARTLGASDGRLMFKHIFPNSLGTIITACILSIPGVIFLETTLTYLGIVNLSGLNNTSIGALLSMGQEHMTEAPHTVFLPAIFVSLLMICFNLFGNGLRDAFNPSLRGAED